jgi:enamine deaminase RidA (YjgF/YER057c/UK114 family)
MTRKLVPSSSPYASIIGFSRAVRVGNHVSVAGTAPIGSDGKTVGIGDPAAQARQCLETLLTRIDDWPRVAEVRGEYFRDVRPVDTVMQVSRFIDNDWLLEIEVDAVVDA